MDTSFIESMIGQLAEDEHTVPELHDLLSAVAARRGLEASTQQLAAGSAFVMNYLELVPYMIKVAFTSACNVGLEREMGRILDMVRSYWIEGDDVVPDDLGVIGLLLLFQNFLMPRHHEVHTTSISSLESQLYPSLMGPLQANIRQ